MMLERFPPASQAKAAVGTRGVCLLGYDRNREITNHNGAIISTLCRYRYVYICIDMYIYIYVYDIYI